MLKTVSDIIEHYGKGGKEDDSNQGTSEGPEFLSGTCESDQEHHRKKHTSGDTLHEKLQ